jgi:hypothetical protein
LLQAPPGSYQFAVRVRRPQNHEQLSLDGMPDINLRVEEITKKFLEIVRSAVQDPDGELVEIVPQKDYRESFLKLTGQLSPPASGKSFDQLEIKSSSDIEPQPVFLNRDTHEMIKQVLTKREDSDRDNDEIRRIQIRGTLRGVQLDKDWIEVSTDGENKRIYDARAEIDDVIGPMVNRQVVVDVTERPEIERKRYSFQYIQLEDDL